MSEWWNELPLSALSAQQWEALCDGCARCCLHKLEDEDTGEVFYTRVHCRLLDADTCRCSDYPRRAALVPDCVQLKQGQVVDIDWLPSTCAYRLRAHNQPLPAWHYLVSGSSESVHRAGISVRGRTLAEQYVSPDDYEELIVNWVE